LFKSDIVRELCEIVAALENMCNVVTCKGFLTLFTNTFLNTYEHVANKLHIAKQHHPCKLHFCVNPARSSFFDSVLYTYGLSCQSTLGPWPNFLRSLYSVLSSRQF